MEVNRMRNFTVRALQAFYKHDNEDLVRQSAVDNDSQLTSTSSDRLPRVSLLEKLANVMNHCVCKVMVKISTMQSHCLKLMKSQKSSYLMYFLCLTADTSTQVMIWSEASFAEVSSFATLPACAKEQQINLKFNHKMHICLLQFRLSLVIQLYSLGNTSA